ncbi:MAG: alanine--tRNA ligase [Verrucomicrobiota bacterium]|nr:alanine--tRNA ligase [Verrucomicrobiota bacterium]
MQSQDIRRSFLKYFKSQGHTIVPSSPVVPHDDPTLLFTNAGMNQFKDIFLGRSKRDYMRAATTQKCIRVGGKHNDLDNVGHTSRHLTFFEMLGNFSFGDYFKKEAIAYAWDIVNHVFGFDPKRIWASVYKDDDEAFALWEKHLPAERIVRFGEKENFWAMGDTGPCGPCSELLYDRGEGYGPARNPKEDLSGERYLEFWNLVFMQYSRDTSDHMEPLPKKSIDTGCGLERIASLTLDVETVYQTDVLRGLIAQVEEISGKAYDEKNMGIAPAFHVIADHIRSLSFAIADGVQPSNTDRGYVLRKILRRAVRYGRMLGLQKPFLADVLPRLVNSMGEDFPELKASQNRIAEIVTLEEESFLRTLLRGGQLLGQVIDRSQKTSRQISGEDAFKLKDTYGFPLEEILLIAKDEALSVDLPRFEKLEEEAKEKSRKAHKTATQQFGANFFSDFTRTHKPCQFEGYNTSTSQAHLIGLVVGEQFVDEIKEGQEGLLLLEKTPFYPEMGGQVGDTGTIGKSGHSFQVYDTTAPFPGVIAHLGKMGTGALHKNDLVQATIDEQRRKEIQNNHTATHLLHWALQQVLGPHIKQAGSLVEDRRLRFDFNHHKPLSPQELRQIENLVNEKVREDAPVQAYEISYDEAQKRSDIKQFFGEKYGDRVRVIDIDFSKELCGGTHVSRLGTIGLFKIAKESSIAAGVRRIEAVTGKYAEELVQQEEDTLVSLATLLKSTPSATVERLQQLLEENKSLSAELKAHRKEKLKVLVEQCLSLKEHVGSLSFIAQEVLVDTEDLNSFADELIQRLHSGVVVLGIKTGERCQLVIAVSSDLVQKNILASHLIKEAAPFIQGGGGGKQTLAQAGGKNPAGLPLAFDKVRELLKQ